MIGAFYYLANWSELLNGLSGVSFNGSKRNGIFTMHEDDTQYFGEDYK